jgi:glycosyltransferase involved in cell wall biosynthesis
MKKKTIFISWTSYHSHTQQLGKAFNAEIFYIGNLINSRNLIWKLFFLLDYFYKSVRTIFVILRTRPTIVVVQNPPSIAPVVIVFFSLIIKYKTVIDSHNGAFEKPWVNLPFHTWALRHSNIVIVHNNQVFKEVTDEKNFQNINFKKLGSKPSDFDIKERKTEESPYFLVIATFHNDEPMEILLKGIREYNNNNTSSLKFKVTGNYKKNLNLYNEFSKDKNIEFLGFISQDDYNLLLTNAYGSIALSTRDNVQQYAVIESISAGVPFISSDNMTNRELFGNKAILTENAPTAIAESIELFISDRERLLNNVLRVKKTFIERWQKEFNNIQKELTV